MSGLDALLSSLQMQYNVMNSILRNYGIEIQLSAIKLSSEECDMCVEYITLIKFKDRVIYEEFTKKLKEQMVNVEGENE
jgi:hypothetical protein